MFSNRHFIHFSKDTPTLPTGLMTTGTHLSRPSRLALATLVAGLLLLSLAAAPSSAARMPLLHLGSHGPAVAKAQRLLHVPADGIFGRGTAKAVRTFQRAHHLLVDGQIGSGTWKALRHRSGGSRAHPKSDGILRKGEKGTRVGEVQRLLGIRVNRLFDQRTFLAVSSFQRRRGLFVDGEVGPHTWRALHTGAAGKQKHHGKGGGKHRSRKGDGVLQRGEKGHAVGRLQRLLHIRVNRLFDRRTWLAVRGFQRRHGLLVDGEVGPATWAALTHRGSGGGGGHHRSLAAQALAVARQYVGVPYVWGGSTPKGFDCSGLIWYAYRRLGVEIPRVTYAQWYAGPHIGRRHLRPGDLVFFHHRGHVALWIGHGWFLHAPRTGDVVKASQMRGWYARHYDGAVRIGG
jgi:cell wall-associated NlpC family hydrolase